MSARRAAVLLLGLSLAAAACRKEDPVRGLLAALEEAAEDRDADAVRDRLADDFQAAGGLGRADVYALVRRYLAAYESVRLEVYDVKVDRREAVADVRARVDFTGTARRLPGLAGLLPPSASYVFDLHVVGGDGGWKVSRAEWHDAAAPSP